jgi:hypothetical protein
LRPVLNRKAECHPDRQHWARGMCKACYIQVKNRKGFVAMGRTKSINSCGHPNKKHVGHGMCGACYSKHLRLTDPKYSKIARKDECLRLRYGITLAEKSALLEAQGGKCALCVKPLSDNLLGRTDAHVDHCHESGRVRGILCFTCNKALGMLGDTLDSMERVVTYLKRAA